MRFDCLVVNVLSLSPGRVCQLKLSSNYRTITHHSPVPLIRKHRIRCHHALFPPKWGTIISRQVAYRAFRCRGSYQSLLARRRRAAVMLQSCERKRRACRTAAFMAEQQLSSWEQLWDDSSGCLYYFHTVYAVKEALLPQCN